MNVADPDQPSAQKPQTLSLFVGESFVEAQILQNNKQLKFTRWYLGKENLKNGLQKFMQDRGSSKLSQVFVASRFLEKILTYRLGGSVAVITTKGFENWALLREPSKDCHRSGAVKFGPLSAPELYFTVDERCDAQGRIEKELTGEQIQELVEKLKAKQAKRVCVHLLNAHKNPANQNRLATALAAENFEIFLPQFSGDDIDEVSHWRKNILNASLSGTFDEIQEEINDGLKDYLPEGIRASFLCSEGGNFDRENQYRLTSLWGAQQCWVQALKKKSPKENFQILHLGLEQFSLLDPQKTETRWKSPWGQVFAPQVANRILCLQPTNEIEVSEWGSLTFSKNIIGYEPGPMFMGRGQIPCLLDLWAEQVQTLQGIEDRKSATGLQKFKNQLMALNKTAKTPQDGEEKTQAHLRELALQKLTLDINIHAEADKIFCLGALAPVFANELKKRLPRLRFEILTETESSLLRSGS